MDDKEGLSPIQSDKERISELLRNPVISKYLSPLIKETEQMEMQDSLRGTDNILISGVSQEGVVVRVARDPESRDYQALAIDLNGPPEELDKRTVRASINAELFAFFGDRNGNRRWPVVDSQGAEWQQMAEAQLQAMDPDAANEIRFYQKTGGFSVPGDKRERGSKSLIGRKPIIPFRVLNR